MGRLLNPRAVDLGPSLQTQRVPPPSAGEFAPATAATVAAPALIARPSPVQIIGLVSLSIYLISGWATDFSYRLFGAKPYLSVVTGVIVFFCFIISGNALSAFRTTVGKLWLALGVWMILSIVFSRWRGGSLELMQAYIPKLHMIPFYMAAFSVTANDSKTLLRACAIGGYMTLLSCVFLGGEEFGRFILPTNMWLNNPNDLALQLLLCLGFFLFWFRQPNWTGRVAGAIGIAGVLFYLPKTGSRGGIISTLLLLALWVFFSKRRLAVIASVLFACLVAFALVPSQILHRFTILTTSNEQAAVNEDVEKAVSSQVEREHLLKASIHYTLTYPLFGVGPGEFADALWRDGKKQGRHEASLGPHNTYLQVGAECGVPALVLFTMAILVTIRSSYRLYRATEDNKDQGLFAAVAFSCFVLTVAFAVDLCFHHVAYSGNLVVILGLWITIENAARLAGIDITSRRPASDNIRPDLTVSRTGAAGRLGVTG
jgi:O-antigen ligase